MKNIFDLNDEEKRLTIVLTKSHICYVLLPKLVEEHKDKSLLLWQKNDYEINCKILKMTYGMDLLKTMNSCLEEFDICIIDHFIDNYGQEEVMHFLTEINTNNKYKNKKFIIFITAYTENNEISFEDYSLDKDTLLNICDNLFILNKDKKNLPYGYTMKNLLTKETVNFEL